MSQSVLRVLVIGAGGRMGRQVCAAVAAAPGLSLVGGVDQPGAGALDGVPLFGDVPSAVAATGPAVAIDFTVAAAARLNLPALIAEDVSPVIGTTGLNEDDLEQLDQLGRERGVAALIAPNFAIGAVLMMRFAAEAARHFASAEITELHHDQKRDAPSGTALRTAEAMLAARGGPFEPPPVESLEQPVGARGGELGGLRVHSVRLPGLVADQEVILGGVGETLTIAHRTLDRSCFMPGVILAARRVRGLPAGLTVGLDTLLFAAT